MKNPDPGDRSLVTTLQSDAAGSSCPATTSDPGCTSVVPVLRPGLLVSQTASTSTVEPGGVVGYTVTVTNTGETTQTGVTVQNSFDQVLTDAVYDGNATTTAGTVSYAAPALTWTGTLAPGASATISYSVTVRDPDPGDKLLLNRVSSTAAGSNCAPGSTDPRCSTAVLVTVPALTLATTADRATTVRDEVVTFIVTVTNSGATSYAAATVEDSLPGLLDDAAYRGDATATSGQVSVSGATLRWTGSLTVGASATITFSASVNREDVGDDLLTTALSSTTRGSTCAAGSTNTRCGVTVPVARLVIQRNAREATATPGSTIHIPATYTNTGQVPYTGITVVHPRGDSADDVYATGDDTATSGSLTRTDDAIRWTGDIAVGGSVTVDITRIVRDPDPGNHVATATITSDAPGTTACPAPPTRAASTGSSSSSSRASP